MLSTYVTRKDPYIEEFVGPVRQNAVNQSILVLSSSIEPAFPLVNYANVRYDYPALFLFHLPALYASARGTNSYPVYRVPAEMGKTEKWFLDMLVDTMERHPPQIMIVNTEDHKQGFPGMRFDFLRYYLGDDRFRQRWAHYRFLRRYSYYDIYRLDESL